MASAEQKYRIIDKLDAGGMAEIYRAEAELIQGMKKKVAIKRILPHLTKNEKFVAMFLDEARLSLYLDHANIVHTIDFVAAARSQGLGSTRILFRHLLPNAMGPVFVAGAFGVAGAILVESALSFLGFGVPPPQASWGSVLHDSRGQEQVLWWVTIFPGLLIFVTVTAYNLVGEGLRDALDPRLRQ